MAWCVLLALLAPIALNAQEIIRDPEKLLLLSIDGDLYLSSTGGSTANGCEAWLTMLASGETVYVARCDPDRLMALELDINSAMELDSDLDPRRQVVSPDEPMMMDFVDFQFQALLGETANGAVVYVVMDRDRNLVYYRAEGDSDQLSELGFDVGALLGANSRMVSANRIINVDGRLNVAERVSDRAQMVIGKTTNGNPVAIVLDSNGEVIQVIAE